MLIDWFTVAAQIANFAILVWLLKRFLYRPVLAAMAAREQRVRDTVAAADKQKAEAEAEASRLRAQQQELDRQKATLLKTAQEGAAAARQEMLAAARKETDERAAQWRESLAREWQDFRTQLLQRTQNEALAIAGRALCELADAPLEERVAEMFLKKLAALGDSERARLRAIVNHTPRPMVVRSGFPLAEPVREKLRRALQEQLLTTNHVEFSAAPDVIAGIEVSFDGQKLVWTLQDYLHSLGAGMDELIEKEAKSDGAAG